MNQSFTNEILKEIKCKPIHRLVLREIFNTFNKNLEEKNGTEIKTVYEKVGEKLGKSPCTVKSILKRAIANSDYSNMSNKKFVRELIEKAKK